MKNKTFSLPIEFKTDGQPGEFRAIFSRFNVIDHDGDVTIPGAFKDGEAVRISYWGHRWQDLPVGRGIIHQDDKTAWVDGQFFLDTQAGKETYQTVKNLGELQEWSYGYDVNESETGQFENQDVQFLNNLTVYEISPVMLGAGIDTETIDIKGLKRAVASHSTETTDVAWSGPTNEARVRSGESVTYYKRIYAWQDVEGDPEVKSSWRFIHHMIDGDGNPGAANIRACQTGIGVLNGGRGGTTIPDADRQGVWNHLAKHLRDAEVEPPELKSIDPLSLSGNNPEDETGDPPKNTAGAGKSSGKVDVIRTQISILELED